MNESLLPEEVRALLPLSPMDFHLLLVLAEGELYGYAIMKEVRRASSGTLNPEIGSLYRMLGRLMKSSLVEEAGDRVPDAAEARNPGHPRRYYRITSLGLDVLRAEASRVQGVLAAAARKRLLPSRRS